MLRENADLFIVDLLYSLFKIRRLWNGNPVYSVWLLGSYSTGAWIIAVGRHCNFYGAVESSTGILSELM